MHVLPCYKWIWSYLPLWTSTYVQSVSHASLFFGFLCLPCLLPPFTVPCKMVLARPDERETWSYHCSLRLFTMFRRSSCSPTDNPTKLQFNWMWNPKNTAICSGCFLLECVYIQTSFSLVWNAIYDFVYHHACTFSSGKFSNVIVKLSWISTVSAVRLLYDLERSYFFYLQPFHFFFLDWCDLKGEGG